MEHWTLENLKDALTDIAVKLHAVVYVFTLLMIFNFAAATAEVAYNLPPHSVPAALIAIAVLWEAGERLILRIRLRRMRKKGC